MSDIRDQRETIDATIEDDEPIRVVVEEKEGFFKKCGKGMSKFAHSTPGKIIGGLTLVGLGAVGAVLCIALSGKDDDDQDDVIDCTQFVEIDEQEESNNEEVE